MTVGKDFLPPLADEDRFGFAVQLPLRHFDRTVEGDGRRVAPDAGEVRRGRT
ncbi:MAG: hypothetical protein ACLTZY_00860 [Alistipes indistinctus]